MKRKRDHVLTREVPKIVPSFSPSTDISKYFSGDTLLNENVIDILIGIMFFEGDFGTKLQNLYLEIKKEPGVLERLAGELLDSKIYLRSIFVVTEKHKIDEAWIQDPVILGKLYNSIPKRLAYEYDQIKNHHPGYALDHPIDFYGLESLNVMCKANPNFVDFISPEKKVILYAYSHEFRSIVSNFEHDIWKREALRDIATKATYINPRCAFSSSWVNIIHIPLFSICTKKYYPHIATSWSALFGPETESYKVLAEDNALFMYRGESSDFRDMVAYLSPCMIHKLGMKYWEKATIVSVMKDPEILRDVCLVNKLKTISEYGAIYYAFSTPTKDLVTHISRYVSGKLICVVLSQQKENLLWFLEDVNVLMGDQLKLACESIDLSDYSRLIPPVDISHKLDRFTWMLCSPSWKLDPELEDEIYRIFVKKHFIWKFQWENVTLLRNIHFKIK